MEFATGALGTLLPKLAQLLQDEYNLHKNAKKDIQFLSRELETMRAALRNVGEVPREQLSELFRIWARDVRELSYDIEDIIDTFLVRVQGPDPPSKKSTKRFFKKMIQKVTKATTRWGITQDIKDTCGHMQTLSYQTEAWFLKVREGDLLGDDARERRSGEAPAFPSPAGRSGKAAAFPPLLARSHVLGDGMRQGKARCYGRRTEQRPARLSASSANLRLARRRMSEEIRRVVEDSPSPPSNDGEKLSASNFIRAAMLGELSSQQFIKAAMEVGFSMQDILRAEQELQVIFRGTFWLRQWAKLQRSEEYTRWLQQGAHNLEVVALSIFTSFGWHATARIAST